MEQNQNNPKNAGKRGVPIWLVLVICGVFFLGTLTICAALLIHFNIISCEISLPSAEATPGIDEPTKKPEQPAETEPAADPETPAPVVTEAPTEEPTEEPTPEPTEPPYPIGALYKRKGINMPSFVHGGALAREIGSEQ